LVLGLARPESFLRQVKFGFRKPHDGRTGP
jgi:hypothetical protein